VNQMSEGKSEEKRVIELLEELVKWTKVTSIPKVKELLEEFVKTSEEKMAYTYSDGKRTVREVAEMAQTNKSSVSNFWRKWIKSGIAQPISAAGGGNRAKSIFSLEDFAIETPVVSKAKTKTSPKEDIKTVNKEEEETAAT
jgi:hypothetical protein